VASKTLECDYANANASIYVYMYVMHKNVEVVPDMQYRHFADCGVSDLLKCCALAAI
jgi:hypothetical protein